MFLLVNKTGPSFAFTWWKFIGPRIQQIMKLQLPINDLHFPHFTLNPFTRDYISIPESKTAYSRSPKWRRVPSDTDLVPSILTTVIDAPPEASGVRDDHVADRTVPSGLGRKRNIRARKKQKQKHWLAFRDSEEPLLWDISGHVTRALPTRAHALQIPFALGKKPWYIRMRENI